ARLQADIGRKREQLLPLKRERRRLLPLGAADVDAPFEIDRPSARRIEGGIARRHPLHSRLGVAVAIAARLAGGAVLAAPQRLAGEHPQRAGIAGVVVLHGAGVAAHELVAGFSLGERDLAGERARAGEDAGDDGRCRPHSTVMAAEAVASKPLSPVQAKLSVPLSVAAVEKVKNGLAGIAGEGSGRKISSPLYLQTKSMMMSRGSSLPELSGRKPVSITCEIRVLISMISPRLAFAGTLIRVRAMVTLLRGRPPA